MVAVSRFLSVVDLVDLMRITAPDMTVVGRIVPSYDAATGHLTGNEPYGLA